MQEQGVLELATLGRPMQLGMLYDCRKDSLIPGLTLWDPAVLQNDRDVRPQPGTQFHILASDEVDDKASCLNVDASLKASFLGGLVEVQGSAKFLNDKRSSNRQTRLTLHYKTTSRFEQLTMKQLGRHNVQHSDIFDQGTATHVVTGILYGAQAFFVFDRDCTSEENIQDVQGHLHGMVKMVASFEMDGSGSLKSSERESVDKIRCKFHGDFNLENNPSNYEEALSVCKKLPSMLGSNGENAVPMQVWLYPLYKLDHKAAKLVRQISVNLISQSQGILEGMEDLEVKCNDMIMSDVCADFPQFKDKLCALKRLILEYKFSFQQNLAQTLPAIRGGGVEEQTLADALRFSVQSPFGLQKLNDWVASKEKEMNVVKACMKLFAGIQVIRSRAAFDELVLDPLVKNVICFSFPLVGSEEYLESLSEYLKSADGLPPATSKPTGWFDDKSTSTRIISRAGNFAEFYHANTYAGNTETAFAVTAFGDDEKPVSDCSVLLYEEGVLTTKSFEPPSRPGKASVCSKSHDEVTLSWLPPKSGLSEVKHYQVQFRKTKPEHKSRFSDWQKEYTSSDERRFTVRNLQPFTSYEFRVAAVCRAGVSQVNENSDACTTLPAGPPTQVRKHGVSESSLTIVWDPPASLGEGVRIEHYGIRFRQMTGPSTANTKQAAYTKTTGYHSCLFIIDNLQANEIYRISVTAVCGSAGNGSESEPIEIVTDPVHKPAKYAKKITENAEVLTKGCEPKGAPTIFKIPLVRKSVASVGKYRSFSFGERSGMVQQHKVIMVVGATGVGKSTLINGMINYIIGVDWKDGFRFKIIDDDGEGTQSQAHSQTQTITSYTIYRNKHHNVPYTLTIIDTPGFGDTRGIQRDKAIVEQIRDFFYHPGDHHVDHIDTVGFVVQSSQARLTAVQNYVLDSVLTLFGVDVKPNILLLVTFCDNKTPEVISAVQEAGIPYSNKEFKFNNSALFARNEEKKDDYDSDDEDDETLISKLYWRRGMKNMQLFFQALETLEPKSLTLTKKVLDERKRLENAIEGIEPQIQVCIDKLEQLTKEMEMLELQEEEIEANKDFHFEADVAKFKKVTTDVGSMNCDICHFTCHYPCRRGDKDREKCRAFARNGYCIVCPGRCIWSAHVIQNYRMEYSLVKEKQTYADIEMRYKDASGKKISVEEVIEKLETEVRGLKLGVSALIQESNLCDQRLREIALKPHPVGVLEYIDLLIANEKENGKPGWQTRVARLEQTKRHENMKIDVAEPGNFERAWGAVKDVFGLYLEN